MKEIYPWQQIIWQQWQTMHKRQCLPHALLLSGLPGMAKFHFAEQAASYLLCDTQNLCQHCFSCRLEKITDHPDFYCLGIDEDNKSIKVDQIRQLIESLNQTAHKKNRIIIISPADAMNLAASNALLKTLEEPPEHCYFWLVSAHAARLPATIRSRCQRLHLAPDVSHETIQWLQLQTGASYQQAQASLLQAEGSPQQALLFLSEEAQQHLQQLYQEIKTVLTQPTDILNIAQRWQQYGLSLILDQLLQFYHQASIQDQVLSSSIDKQFESLSLLKMTDFSQLILQTKKDLILHPTLNTQLLAESLLNQWYQLAKA